jgi:osmotically-inducible protein OsmY
MLEVGRRSRGTGAAAGEDRTKGVKVSNEDLELNVSEELLWDPKVDNAAIAVSADDGVVTLRGTVGSFRQKREAKQDAQRVYGVEMVSNELQVRILDAERRDDAELRGAVLQALTLDSLVPSTIDAKVDAGWVTLTGTANWQFERDEAQFIASNVLGVVAVDGEIELVAPSPSAGDVKHSIKKAMERNAKLDADGVSVDSSDGQVTLHGTVSSWAEHDDAVDAAWAAPGVTRVQDRILVAY